MNSLYFINELGILTSNHGFEVLGIKSYKREENFETLLFLIKF